MPPRRGHRLATERERKGEDVGGCLALSLFCQAEPQTLQLGEGKVHCNMTDCTAGGRR